MAFECEIISVSELLYEGKTDRISLPGIEGEFTVLQKHSPMITLLGMGVIKVHYEKMSKFFTVYGGTVDVRPEKVIVLAGVAENVENLDLQQCLAKRDEAKANMKAEENYRTKAFQTAKASYLRHNNRVKAIRMHSKKR